MAYIGNSPGLAKRQLFRYIATAGQTSFSGPDVNFMTLNYTAGLEDVYLNGWYIPPENYTRVDASTILFSAALAVGDEVTISAAGPFSPADTFSAAQDGADILSKPNFRRNINVPSPAELYGLGFNPFFNLNQERGTTATSITSNATQISTADQWYASKNGTNVFSMQTVTGQLDTVAGFAPLYSGLNMVVTTAQASLATTEYATPFLQSVEGTFIKQLALGTSSARSIDVVFVATASQAGAYALSVRNAAGTRSYVTTFNLAANTPTVIFKTIPGDTSGTWVKTNAASLSFSVGAVTGTTFQTSTLDAWGAGNFLSHSSCTNWSATNSATLRLNYFNFFLGGVLPYTSGSDANLLAALPTLGRDDDLELVRCQRYFQKITTAIRTYTNGYAVTANGINFRTPMRVQPTATSIGGGVSVNYSTYTFTPTGDYGGYVQMETPSAGDSYVMGYVFHLYSRLI